jgi:hypothetical protein
MKKIFRTSAFTWVALLGALLISACIKESADKAPPSLVIYPKSEDVSFNQRDEIWQVYYVVQVDYPAEDVLQFIATSLERQGWQPLREDIFNVGQPSSHVTGWRAYVDSRTSPNTHVRQWLAQWRNPEGDVVWYVLQYRHEAESSPAPMNVSVNGSYYPANVVKQQLKWVEEDKRERP